MMQDPQGGPPQGPAPQSSQLQPPRMPPLQMPQVGPDSPPALGLIQDPQGPPPPILPDLQLPDVLPADHGAATALIQRVEQQTRNLIARANHQVNLDIMQGVQRAPGLAANLDEQLLMQPEAQDYGGEISALEPYLPKSRTQELRARRQRYEQFADKRKTLREQLTEELKTAQPGDISRKAAGVEATPEEISRRAAQGFRPATVDEQFNVAGLAESLRRRQRGEVQETYDQKLERTAKQVIQGEGAAGAGLRDVGRGLTSPFTGETTVEDEMFGRLNRMVDKLAPKIHGPDERVKSRGDLARITGYHNGPPGPGTDTKFDEAWQRLSTVWDQETAVRDSERAALTDEGMRVIRSLKGESGMKDFVSGATGVLPWAVEGAGELAVAARAANTLIKGTGLAARAGRAAITYSVGPAAMQATIASQQPLPATWKAEVEATEDPQKRDAKEGAYRILQVSQAAATAALFQMSDVLRGATGKALAQKGIGRQAWDIARMGLAAPALAEGSNVAVSKVADQFQTGEVGKAGEIADLTASGKLGGPTSRLLRAAADGNGGEFWPALLDYAEAATPMMAGMTVIHAGSALGAKFRRRPEMLDATRRAEGEIDAMKLDEPVAEELKAMVRKEAEAMAPSAAADRRQHDVDVLTDVHGGPEEADAVVTAHEVGQDLLSHVPGETIPEKLAAAEQRAQEAPGDAKAQRDLDVARRLKRAQDADSVRESALETARARQVAGEARPADEVLAAQTLRRNLATEERPGARDEAIRTVAEDEQREWRVVGRDEEAGTVALRATDDDAKRLVVPERDLVRYRLAEQGGTPMTGRQALNERVRRGIEEVTAKDEATGRWIAQQLDQVSAGGEDFRGPVADTMLDIAERHKLPWLRDAVEELQRIRGEAPSETATGAESRPQAPSEAQPRVVDDHYDLAVSVAKALGGGDPRAKVPVTQIQKALGVSKARAVKIAQQMVEGGVLVKDPRGYRLAGEEPTAAAAPLTESAARDQDLTRIGMALLNDAGAIAVEHEAGSRTTIDEHGDRIARDLIDYGDIANPAEPEEGRARMAARMLLEMPPEARTDAALRKLGFDKDGIERVRAEVERQTPKMLPEDIAEAGRDLLGSQVQAGARRALPERLPEHLRETFDKDGADAAFKDWAQDHPSLRGKSLGETVEATQKHVDDLHRKVFSKRDHVRRASLERIADLIGEFDGLNDLVALYSLDEGGRAVLGRLEELRTQMLHELAIKPPMGKRKGKPGEAGFLNVQPLAEVLLSLRDASILAWRMAKTALWHAYRAGSLVGRGLIKAGATPVSAALRLARKLYASPKGDLRLIEERADTVVSKNAGKGDLLGFKDQLSAHGEVAVSATFAAERSGAMGAIVRHARDILHRTLLKQDSAIDHGFKEWVRARGMPEPADKDSEAWHDWSDRQKAADKFEAKWTDEQRDVAQAIRDQFAQNLDMIGQGVHPKQVMRTYTKKILERTRDAFNTAIAEKQQALLDAVDAMTAVKEGVGAEDVDALLTAEGNAKRAKRELDSYKRGLKDVETRMGDVESRYQDFLQRWGVRREGYAPDIADRNVREAAKEAAAKTRATQSGMLGAPMGMDVDAAVHEIEAMHQQLPEMAKHHVNNDVARHLMAGHQMKREGKLEESGNLDKSFLRSWFHYTNELYRLLPAVDWMRTNMERLYGEVHPLTLDEITLGRHEDGHEVEWMQDEDPQNENVRLRRQLVGRVFELHQQNLKGQERTVYYRNANARNEAFTLAKAEGERLKAIEKPDEKDRGSWFSEDPKKDAPFAAKIALVDPAVASSTQARPSFFTDESGIVHLPRAGKELLLPSQALGRLMRHTGGELDRVAKANPKDGETTLRHYIGEVLKVASGRAVLTKAQRVAQGLGSILSHKLLGLMNPASAMGELLGGFYFDITQGRMPILDRLEGSLLATEYSSKTEKALHDLQATPGEYLRQHQPKLVDGEHIIAPEAVAKALRTAKEDLAKLSPKRQAKIALKEDAFQFVHESMLGGSSAIDFFSGGSEPTAYGKIGKFEGASRAALRYFEKGSWLLRSKATHHNVRAALISAYLIARKGGRTDAQARDIARRFMLANGNVQNRVTQSRFMDTAVGRLLRPAYGWQAAVASTNWRDYFHRGVAGGISKFAGALGLMWLYQQMGYQMGIDVTRYVGNSLSDVPLVGDKLTYGARKAQALVGLAANPDVADQEAAQPRWRTEATSWLQNYAPQWMHEMIARRTRHVGESVDAPFPIFWGLSAPADMEVLKNFGQAGDAWWNGDQTKADMALNRALFGQQGWIRVYNRMFQSRPDPGDPNYLLLRHPLTGATVQRVRKENDFMMLMNSIVPDPEQTADRIEGILQKQRVAEKLGSARTIADNTQALLRQSMADRDAAQREPDATSRNQMLLMADKKEREFTDAVVAEGKRRELSPNETKGLYKQWTRVAKSQENLTAQERNVLNAYDADDSFALMSQLLEDPIEPMTRKRFWDILVPLWYTNAGTMKDGLKRAKVATANQFLGALKKAEARWAIDGATSRSGR